MKTVIMAGGIGSRISSVANDIPKPLIKINGKPILEHEIECLKNQGYRDIIITTCYMSNKITEYFGNGRKFGVNIEYYIENTPKGNAGALYELGLQDDFLLINADSFFDVDLDRFVKYHKEKNSKATVFTHPNSHPFDSTLIVSHNGIVEKWLTKEDIRPTWYKNCVNAGLHILSPELLKIKPEKAKVDLDKDILKPLAQVGKLFCYNSPEYVKDMGTPERYYEVCKDFAEGRIYRKNLKQPQKAIFLDRDGTINKYVGFLRKIDQFELLPSVSEAIKIINKSDFLAIVVTNQPVIARGEVTENELNEIHNKMETLLGKEGAYIDALYYCPHHNKKGFPGEVASLKFDCDCRKPKPGLLFKAAKDFNINLSESWMIGDSDDDVKAGINAGCKTIKIQKDDFLINIIKEIV